MDLQPNNIVLCKTSMLDVKPVVVDGIGIKHLREHFIPRYTINRRWRTQMQDYCQIA